MIVVNSFFVLLRANGAYHVIYVGTKRLKLNNLLKKYTI